MRFVLFMHPNISDDEYASAGEPDLEVVKAMNAYNEELTKAGVLLALDGLHGPDTAAVVRKQGDEIVVTDGPFAEAKEAVGGYWIIDVKDRDEAIEWARRVPLGDGPAVEVRQIWDVSEMSDEVREAAQLSQEPRGF